MGNLLKRALVGGIISNIANNLLQGQQSCNEIECLPPHLKTLAERYRNAIADVLGVPPEAIREDVVVRWVQDWVKAYVKPEYAQYISGLIYGDYGPYPVEVVEEEGVTRRGYIY